MNVVLTRPDKESLRISLKDDGKSDDAFPHDGIFAASIPFTMAGSYLATVDARVISGDGIPFTILQSRGRFNAQATDRDADGMRDDWEARYSSCAGGLNPRGDPDHDHLTNAEELHIGTDPLRADTDGDGAPDGEEVRNGRDPLTRDKPPGGS